MKRPKTRVYAIWIMLVIPFVSGSAALVQTPASAKLVQIRVTAKRYMFHPDVITVNQGDHVELIITATDRDHGIEIPAFGVKQYLKRGVPTAVSFIASRAGTFSFHCSVFCGLGHRHMKARLVVEANH